MTLFYLPHDSARVGCDFTIDVHYLLIVLFDIALIIGIPHEFSLFLLPYSQSISYDFKRQGFIPSYSFFLPQDVAPF